MKKEMNREAIKRRIASDPDLPCEAGLGRVIADEKLLRFLNAELTSALKDLLASTDEATIPLVNSHAVRKMAKFIAARDKAKFVLKSVGVTAPPAKEREP